MKRIFSMQDGEARRTDPKSFVVRGVMSLRNAVFPMVAAFFAMRDTSFGLFTAIVAGAAVLSISSLMSYLGWRRFTYRVGEEDIRVEQGIVSRAARSVPYERIQDVSLEQALIPRLFGLVEVKFETGSGGGEDLKLSYLPEAEGERLRELVREIHAGETAALPAAAESDIDASDLVQSEAASSEPGETLFEMKPPRLLRFGMFEFSLAVVAVVFGITQQLDFLLPFDIWDLDEWQELLAGPGNWLAALGPMAQVVGAVLASMSLLAVGVATGIIRTLTREWGFLLQKTPRGFRRRRGLFTKTDVVMPVHRVQALEIVTKMIRYRFGWRALKFVSLAQDAGSSSHVVAPFAQAEEIAPIIRAAGFEPPADSLDWHRASKRHRFDRMVIESTPFVFVAIVVAVAAPVVWFALLPLIGAALTIVGNLYGWQFHKHALDARQVLSSDGYLSPSVKIASRVKLHSVEIVQGPIAQRRGYATVNLGLAGGTFAMSGIPLERARQLRRSIMESISATDFSKLA